MQWTPHPRCALNREASAPTCMIADALTTILVQLGDINAGYFRDSGARAFMTSPVAVNAGAA